MARELFERDYNISLHFSVAALYFLIKSLAIFCASGLVFQRLNRHLPPTNRKIRFRPNHMR